MNTINALEEKVIKKLTRKLIPLLMILYAIAMIDRLNISYASLTMNKDLGISASMYGLLSGVFFLAYFIFEIPSNILMHKMGARIWISRILISWGIVCAVMGFVQSFTQITILRILLGIAEAGFYPSIILYLTFWFPKRHMAKALALFIIAGQFAGIILGPLSTWMLDNINWAGLQSWRWLFIIQGIPAVIFGILAIFVMIDRPEKAKFLNDEEKQWLITTLKSEYEEKTAEVKLSKAAVFKQPIVWILALALFFQIIGSYGVAFWLPQILKGVGNGISNFQIGLLSALAPLCAVISMYFCGRHSDKTMERRLHASIPLLIFAFAMVGLSFAKSILPAVILLCLCQAGTMTFSVVFWSIPTSMLGEAAAAVGIALISSMGNFGGFVGPFLIGFLKDKTGTMTVSMYVIAALSALGSIIVLSVVKGKDGALVMKNTDKNMKLS